MKEIKTVDDIREAYLEFFKQKGHSFVESAPLLAKNDPSLLFVNSGMVPFKDCFTGQEKRPYTRATSCQKSLRVSGKHNDYEQIGTTPRHHTFFEMLGNFSFGDYFKSDAIPYAWEFVTEVLKLDKSMLWVTVHKVDDEAEKLWTELTDINPDRIVKMDDDTNRWAMGDTGPNGYCSEIFYYMGDNPDNQNEEEFLKDDGTYLEIWNLVFMQFNKRPDGTVEDLPKPCIDTGMGLERVAAIKKGVASNYDTDCLRGLISKIEKISAKKYEGNVYNLTIAEGDEQYVIDASMRVIADHARSITFLISDGVSPSNEGEGYVLRRLIRRSIRFGQLLGIEKQFLSEVTSEVIKRMSGFYKELEASKSMITKLVKQEEEQFQTTLKNGLKVLDEEVAKLEDSKTLSGKAAFKLYDTFGFPVDLTQEILSAKKINVDMPGFDKALTAQKERSRASRDGNVAEDNTKFEKFSATKFLGYSETNASSKLVHIEYSDGISRLLFEETPFYAEKGGQIGDSGVVAFEDSTFDIVDTRVLAGNQTLHYVNEEVSSDLVGEEFCLQIDQEKRSQIASHHSGTHLLNAGLIKILGDHVQQRGSLVTEDKLRFDFSHFEGLKEEELNKIENYVNEHISKNEEVSTIEMSIEEAKKSGAVAAFGEKYGSTVRVVEMGPSKELCGGTHVNRTGDIGLLVLTSESSISSGVRRVEALCGKAAHKYINNQKETLKELSKKLKSKPEELSAKLDALLTTTSALKNEIKNKDLKLAKYISESLISSADNSIIAESVEVEGRDALFAVADFALQKLKSGIIAVGSKSDKMIVIKVSKDLAKKVSANSIVKDIVKTVESGKGGGRDEMATLANIDSSKFDEAFKLVKAIKH